MLTQNRHVSRRPSAAPPSAAPAGPPATTAALVPLGRRRLARLASDLGQGTVEYVGLLLLMATVLAAVVAASSKLGGEDQIGKQVVTQIGESIKVAGKGK